MNTDLNGITQIRPSSITYNLEKSVYICFKSVCIPSGDTMRLRAINEIECK